MYVLLLVSIWLIAEYRAGTWIDTTLVPWSLSDTCAGHNTVYVELIFFSYFQRQSSLNCEKAAERVGVLPNKMASDAKSDWEKNAINFAT